MINMSTTRKLHNNNNMINTSTTRKLHNNNNMINTKHDHHTKLVVYNS